MSESPQGPPQGAPPPSPPNPDPYGLGATSSGLAPHVAAGLSYILTWLTGLIFFLMEKQNKFVRFHAMQAILLGVLYIAVYIVVGVLIFGAMASTAATGTAGVAGGGLLWMLMMLLYFAFFVLWVVCLIMAFTGKWFKIPVLGDLAMKWS